MKKLEQLLHSKSCWNKASDDELVFVLLARDRASIETIRFWANERVRLCLNKPDDEQLMEALNWAKEVENQHRKFAQVEITKQGIKFGDDCWISHEKITGFAADQLNSNSCTLAAQKYMEWIHENLK